jgi:peptidoglycan hydrolase-like protein with peptidoglycan-binding domain
MLLAVGGDMPDENRILQAKEHIPYLASGLYNNWRNLWNKNSALAAKRKNPLILFHGDKDPNQTHQDPAYPSDPNKKLPGNAGDTVVVPDPSEKQASGVVDSHNPFTTRSDKVFLRLRVLDEEFQGFKDAGWILWVDGIKYPKDKAEGKFTADGMIELEVPKVAQVGKLAIMFPVPPDPPAQDASPSTNQATTGSGPGVTQPPAPQPASGKRVEIVVWLEVGRLDPIQEQAPDDKCLSGVQQRLNNLGFQAGVVDGVDGPHCQAAIKRFQRRFLPDAVNGTSDATTQAKLHELHDTPATPPKPAQPQGSAPSSGQPSDQGAQQPQSSTPTTPAKTELEIAREEVKKAEARLRQSVTDAVDASRANKTAQAAKDTAFQKWNSNKNNRQLKDDYMAKRDQAVKTDADEVRARQEMDRAKKDVDRAKANEKRLSGS